MVLGLVFNLTAFTFGSLEGANSKTSSQGQTQVQSSSSQDNNDNNGVKNKIEDLQNQINQLKQAISNLAGGSSGLQNARVEISEAKLSSNPDPTLPGFNELTANCKSSEKVVSGGYSLPIGGAAELTTTDDHIDGNGWKLKFATRAGPSSEDARIRVYALCVPIPK